VLAARTRPGARLGEILGHVAASCTDMSPEFLQAPPGSPAHLWWEEHAIAIGGAIAIVLLEVTELAHQLL
jgi:hypothetical protein